MPSERLRNQLTLMSSALHKAINKIKPEAIKVCYNRGVKHYIYSKQLPSVCCQSSLHLVTSLPAPPRIK